MAINPDRDVDQVSAAGLPDAAPRMLSRPVDPQPRLGHLGDSEPWRRLRETRDHRFADLAGQPMKSRLRTWASRTTGRSDRLLLLALIDATETLMARCDLLADRVSALEAGGAEIAEVLGEEITLLRAEVEHLRTSEPASDVSPHE